jgi:hypothetical protein
VTIKASKLIKNGYLISSLIHLLIILILALIILNPKLPERWHSFEWETPSDNAVSNVQSSQGIVPNAPREVADIPSPLVTPGEVQNTVPTVVSPTPRLIDSPLLEAPAVSTSTSDINTQNRRRAATSLRSMGNTVPGGNSGFSADLEMGSGDAYIIQQPKPMIVPNIDGEVLLEFKLTNRGSVDISSVKVISFSTAGYVEAVQRVLPQWQFGFRGAYQPDKLYRVRCRFVVDE